MVYRVYVEKKPTLAGEAAGLKSDANTLLGISNLSDVRIINRYDAQNIDSKLFEYCIDKVFSEPQLDITANKLEEFVGDDAECVFAVEALPGQFDQRADSAEQCIQIISQGDRPLVKFARVYALYGNLSEAEINSIKNYVINPVETREASLELPKTLEAEYTAPQSVKSVEGFIDAGDENVLEIINEYGLAMDEADLKFCKKYFAEEEHRNPTVTELKMIDTYWSDHCRHTTFGTIIDKVSFADKKMQQEYERYLKLRESLGREEKPICLMDMATIAVKHLKAQGKLDKLDESEEINACTVKINVDVNGISEPWLLLFKNETHNHPTEIEPFGGAATCLGGCIRDPLSGRAYAYSAMRVTGAADPLQPISETLKGKLPQRSITTTAAKGYSSYGNQIGLCTGIVDEIYHPGYIAKRMEVGAVMAAAPAFNVKREKPVPGDVVMLLGGATGRDGIGGATGSSKAHDSKSVETRGAEVQKGNPPEERKIQRLFRNGNATRMIKRCNDFGAGGVSVAIGELADGLDINLDAVPKKYEGLNGTELAISESQERMACVVAAADKYLFMNLAAEENLDCVQVAVVTEDPRLVMHWQGNKIVDISREFLGSNGADKHIKIDIDSPENWEKTSLYDEDKSFRELYLSLADDLNICSKKGLSERFDSTIGAGTVLMPFGGANQLTPIQAMVHKIPLEKGETDDCSLMAWGYNPYISSASPYHGAYMAVVESVAKLIATGASFEDIYLSFQEYFESPRKDAKRWGKPMAALLGALKAQVELGIGSIGGKDSMSGSFEDIDVPPTLISFAVTMSKIGNVISPEFKSDKHDVILLAPKTKSKKTESSGLAMLGLKENGYTDIPDAESLIALWKKVAELVRSGNVAAAYAPGIGGVAEAVMKMSYGNGVGFKYTPEEQGGLSDDKIFGYSYGGILLELQDMDLKEMTSTDEYDVIDVGIATADRHISRDEDKISILELLNIYEDKLENVFPSKTEKEDNTASKIEKFNYRVRSWNACLFKNPEPTVLIPVFPGTNCEYDSARAVREAGGVPEIFIIKNRTSDDIKKSVEDFSKMINKSQMIFIPGGFSGGDEPDGSGKFITAFFRNAEIAEGVTELLEKRDGLMCGICNGFQALIKLGLVPYGKIIDTDSDSPTLTFNKIGCHQSRIIRVRVASNKSPWLRNANVGSVYSAPISHGEGRFIATEELIREMAAKGQIATQYVDLAGNPTDEIQFNPNGSMYAIEGITSPDGRVFGKMGHAERVGKGLYKNVNGIYNLGMFESAVQYFK